MSAGTLPENAAEAAAVWYECLNREVVSADTRSAFETWLGQSAANRAAYDSVRRAWTQAQSAALEPQILALRHETALRLTRRASTTIRPLHAAAAAVVLLVLGGAVATLTGWVGSDHRLLSPVVASSRVAGGGRYATATGERLSVALNDGSQVTLDTQSELEVAFSSTERVVRLLKGQAYLEVAKDHRRAFVVEAHNRRFVAVGTVFDVRVDAGQVRLTMVEGTVRVESLGKPANPAPVLTVTAGQQLIAEAALPDRVSATDPDRSVSWRRGQLIFDNERLADAVSELNRYSATKIELADPKIAQLHLSGAFSTGRPALFVEAITTYFPVQVTRADDRVVVLSAKR
jgi:transmembrane sensor